MIDHTRSGTADDRSLRPLRRLDAVGNATPRSRGRGTPPLAAPAHVRPSWQNWDLPQLRCIATACGMVPLLSSLVLLYMGLSSADGMYPSYASWFGVKVPDAFQNSAGDRWYLPYEQLTTMMCVAIRSPPPPSPSSSSRAPRPWQCDVCVSCARSPRPRHTRHALLRRAANPAASRRLPRLDHTLGF